MEISITKTIKMKRLTLAILVMVFMVYSILIMGTNPSVQELKKIIYICSGCLVLLGILMITVRQSSVVQILGCLTITAGLILFGLFATDSLKITDKRSVIKVSKNAHGPRNKMRNFFCDPSGSQLETVCTRDDRLAEVWERT